MGGEGKAWGCMSLQVYSDSLDIWHLRSGAPLLGSAHSLDTWPQVWNKRHPQAV